MNEPKKMTLRDTIIPKSDQLNYDDFVDGPKTFRVTGLKMGNEEQPVIIELTDSEGKPSRPYKPCKGMRRVLIAVWGDKGKEWIGKHIKLKGNPDVRWAGKPIGGIQVEAVDGIAAPMSCKLTVNRGTRMDYVVMPLAFSGHTLTDQLPMS